MGFLDKIIGVFMPDKKKKDVAEVMPYVSAVNAEYAKLANISDDALRGKTDEFREYLKTHLAEIDEEISRKKSLVKDQADLHPDEKDKIYREVDELQKNRNVELEKLLDELVPEAFAVVKETARRFTENDSITTRATDLDRDLAVDRAHIEISGDNVTYQTTWMAAGNEVSWNMVHYNVQIIGGVTLHKGKIAEMATGEGKTLVATFPAYLNGLTGEGVHIITVNNYLATRDSEWMAPILQWLGLTVDCIDNYKPHSEGRKAAYKCDITYGTNNEFGFDYLRDNMTRNPEELVQTKHHYAMIDEVDSVLVDDARTPLIISGPVEKGEEHEFHELKPRIERLVAVQRKLVNTYLSNAKRKIPAGDSGYKEGEGGLDLFRAFRALPKTKAVIKYLSEPGVRKILQSTENYYLAEQNKHMPEADKELYFTIDEKNNQVDLTERGIELITGSGEDPNFFIMPDLGGLLVELDNDTSLSDEEKVAEKDRIISDFSIKSERLHSLQQLLKAYTLFEIDVEYIVDGNKVKIVDEQTGRVMDGRRYSDGLHQALEAKENVKVEAATQTFATITLQNFFRMYHKLSGMTGTAETEAGELWDIYKLDVVVIPTNRPIVRDDREDLVYRTVREKYTAVIDEIERLTGDGRPVLVGTTSVEISELLSGILNRKGIKHNVLNAKQHSREADVVAEAGQPGTVTIATNMAGRGTDIKLGDGVKGNGGLAIIGTERHDSRRVDRQLRGRAGRQGDPGSSQFYVSLEDNLMRLFGSEKIAGLMDKMGYSEGEVIQHSMITKSIERAQKKVEENNFGIRKRLLEYDDVMNSQREVIYTRRKHALFGDRLSVDLSNTFYDLCEETVNGFREEKDYEGFKMEVIRNFSLSTNISEDDFTSQSAEYLADLLYDECVDFYQRKCDSLRDITRPLIKNVFEERGETLKNVVVPFSDGKRGIRVVSNLQDTIDTDGREMIKSLEKTVSLAFIDEAWKEHLRQMDELKQSVQSAQYEQKDPLLIYKFEAFELFRKMLNEINKDVTSFLFRSNLPIQDPNEVKEARAPQKTDTSRMTAGRSNSGASASSAGQRRSSNSGVPGADRPRMEPVRTAEKVGRNAPCPCGSGKKYKQCHGKNR